MTADNSSATWDSVAGWFGNVIRPVVNSAVLGKDTATELELQKQRLDWARLNGSGPNNYAMAMGVPASWWSFFFGAKGDPKTGAGASVGVWPLALGVVLLVGLLWWVRRR